MRESEKEEREVFDFYFMYSLNLLEFCINLNFFKCYILILFFFLSLKILINVINLCNINGFVFI